MSIVVIEGSNGVGKTTIIDYLSKEYDIILIVKTLIFRMKLGGQMN